MPKMGRERGKLKRYHIIRPQCLFLSLTSAPLHQLQHISHLSSAQYAPHTRSHHPVSINTSLALRCAARAYRGDTNRHGRPYARARRSRGTRALPTPPPNAPTGHVTPTRQHTSARMRRVPAKPDQLTSPPALNKLHHTPLAAAAAAAAALPPSTGRRSGRRATREDALITARRPPPRWTATRLPSPLTCGRGDAIADRTTTVRRHRRRTRPRDATGQ